MTIRRQYQLPNCSLILDGLSIDPSPGSEDVMSLLVNAECRISGLERSLNGGYNFFAALVRAVSQYGQEVLSGYAHPQVIEGEPLLVHINPGEGPYHHLVVQPEVADTGDSGDGRAIDIKLSAVQLFDLTEAVDQFFDDQQTLPELQPALSPLARRFVRTEEPLSDRAMPAVLGVGSLVVATMALGLLPLPSPVEPAIEGRREDTAEIATSDGSEAALTVDAGDTPPDAIAAANTASPLWDSAPVITDDDKVADIQAQLEAKLADNLSPEANFVEPANYQVAVDEDGEVLGYQFTNDAALRDVDNTPLPRLAKDNANADDLATREHAQYQVAFTADGIDVEPWPVDDSRAIASVAGNSEDTEARSASDSAEAENTDTETTTEDFERFDNFKEEADNEAPSAAAIASAAATFSDEPPISLRRLSEVQALNSQLKQAIVENREQPRVGSEASYRVRLTEDGSIIGYQPIGEAATEALKETPLPKLIKDTEEDLASVDYRVVFTERGVVEVSPWWGWSYYD